MSHEVGASEGQAQEGRAHGKERIQKTDSATAIERMPAMPKEATFSMVILPSSSSVVAAESPSSAAAAATLPLALLSALPPPSRALLAASLKKLPALAPLSRTLLKKLPSSIASGATRLLPRACVKGCMLRATLGLVSPKPAACGHREHNAASTEIFIAEEPRLRSYSVYSTFLINLPKIITSPIGSKVAALRGIGSQRSRSVRKPEADPHTPWPAQRCCKTDLGG